ncbi:MAG TPA: hypothetical protein VG944_00965 [Fimbriimonas sp.]|nr:hypothetical protein [Fimbriimonas sp.]
MWFTGGVRVQSAGGSPAFIGAKYRSFLNALDHLTFIEDFVALGLPEEEVVARNSTRIEATLLLLEDLWKKPEFLAFHRIVRNLLYATEFMSDTLIRNFIRSSLLEEHIVKRFDEAREDTQVVRKWVRQRTWMIGRNRKDALYTLWTMVGIPTLDEAFLVKLPAGIYFR